jgi:formylglycine-generating enzyme required for sulfatase activity
MSTGNEDPHGGGEPPLFQASRERGAGAVRSPKLLLGITAAVMALVAWRMLRPAPPPPAPPAPRGAPALQPLPPDLLDGPMVRVAGAKLSLGSTDGDPDEQPITEVEVGPFLLDRFEVTVAAYARCVTAGKCTPPDRGMYCNWEKPGREEHPVNCVDWGQAVTYCTFAGKRLPTEEEWELAARGTDGRKLPWGPGAPGAQLCWNGEGNDLGKGQRQGTCRVGSYPAGAAPSGALDMMGNVWEWTASPYCPYGHAGCGSEAHVIRGGAWNNVDPRYIRAADRAKEGPKSRPDNVGVRCAKPPS